MTRKFYVGGVPLGGGAPVSIQSMTNTPTHDVDATLAQIRALAAAGCDIVRVAVPDLEAARAIGTLKAGSPLPLVADIHFDYRLALAAAEQAGFGIEDFGDGSVLVREIPAILELDQLEGAVLELAELEKEGVGDDVLGDGLKFLIQEAFLHCPRSAGQILMTLL